MLYVSFGIHIFAFRYNTPFSMFLCLLTTSVRCQTFYFVLPCILGTIEPVTPTTADPDLSRLRLVKESELKRTVIIGSGAFGTVFKVCGIKIR